MRRWIRWPSSESTWNSTPVVGDLVAGLGRAAELPEDESADGVVVVVGEVAAELLVEVVDGERAVDAHRVVADALDGLVGQVELVLDLTDDLFEQILERHDSLHRAVFVDHDREMLVRAPELREQRGEILGLGTIETGRTSSVICTDARPRSCIASIRSRMCRTPTMSSSDSL